MPFRSPAPAIRQLRKVALIGPPGSGKTTISDAWCALEGVKAKAARLAFADRIRYEVAVAFTDKADARALMWAMSDPKTKYDWRGLQQEWGERKRAVYGEDYFIGPLQKRIEDLELEPSVVRIAVDDCRFPNEYDMLRDKGFLVIRLEPGPETIKALSASQAHHESEAHWPAFEVDLVLSYEHGPDRQARRIETWLEDLEEMTG